MLRETHTKWLILALAIVCVPLPIGYSVVGGFASLVFGIIFYVQGFQHEGVGPVLVGLVWTSASAWLLYSLSKKITAAIHSTRPLDRPLWLLATFIGFVILSFLPIFGTGFHELRLGSVWGLYCELFQ